MLKHYESGLSKLFLTGRSFYDQPLCWQNMVGHLRCIDPDGMCDVDTFWLTIAQHLTLYNLVIFRNQRIDRPTSKITAVIGRQADLLAWVLTYG